MSAENGNGKKGFAGLDSMLSDVETPLASAPTETNPPSIPRSDPTSEEPVPSRPAYSSPAPSGGGIGGSGKWWLIGCSGQVFSDTKIGCFSTAIFCS